MKLRVRLLPIIIALVLVGLLFISWTPNWENSQFLRSTKPYASFQYQLGEQPSSTEREVAEDLENRLLVRHEWHKVDAKTAQYDVSISIDEATEQSRDYVTIEATIKRDDKRIDQVIVRGEAAVKNELAGRIVSLLTDRIEADHKANSEQAEE